MGQVTRSSESLLRCVLSIVIGRILTTSFVVVDHCYIFVGRDMQITLLELAVLRLCDGLFADIPSQGFRPRTRSIRRVAAVGEICSHFPTYVASNINGS